MNFIDAVKKCLNNYANFNGRARRSEYWWFFLFNILIGIVAGIIDVAIFGKGPEDVGILGTTTSLALLLPNLAVAVRRVHDVGKSGWFILIPIYNLILVCTEGDMGSNEYGSDPKRPEMEDEIEAIGKNI
ncbi:DUF805 domain-containing protein [Ferruginibacter yonginensis]|uniref:DUF805 domain-containing protein n=1 Tax=Ferruginibacter yonginensis TaxID=1310416 RepID=A0ABV8QPI6_9BACT